MVGSSDSIGDPNVILNTIVAESFCDACDRLEAADDFDMAVHDLIKEYMTAHKRIIFNGNGYSPEWVKEAERRGLPNLPTMLDAVEILTTDKSISLFEKFGIFTKAELESREDVLYETYSKTINIEANTMVDMASKQLIPAEIKFIGQLASTVNACMQAGVPCDVERDLLCEVSGLLAEMRSALDTLKDSIAKAREIEDHKESAFFYRDGVKVAMDALRIPADKLEMLTDKELWPIPTYADLIFEV